ncbi:reverse transcriptase domain-containing protein [Tanacetum coccineum]
MHTRASNYEFIEPLAESEQTLNRRLRRQNMRVLFERRDERPKHPRIIYPPILDINYFRHFLEILENYNPMDDEPMWDTDSVVASTLGSAITIPETANEFAIKADDIFLYKTPNQAYQLLEYKVLLKLDWANNKKFKPSLKKIVAFADEGSSNSDTEKIMARMDAMTMKMDAQYKEFQSRSKCNYCGGNHSTTDCNDDDTPMSLEEEAKFMQTFRRMPNYGKFLKELVSNKHKLEQISYAFMSDKSSAMIQNKVPHKLEDPKSFLIPCTLSKILSCNALAGLGASINLMPYSLYAKLSLKTLKPTKMSVRLADRSFQYPIGIAENMFVEVGEFIFLVDFVILEMEEDSEVPFILRRPFLHTTDAIIRVKQKQFNLGVGTERMTFSIDSAIKHSYSNDDTCFSIDVIDEILEEYFKALLDEGSKMLYSIEGTLLEDKIFAEFDEFMTMNIEENTESKSDKKEPTFKKITFNTDYKIKTSLEEPPLDLELQPLPDHLEYVFLEELTFLPVIISSQLSEHNKRHASFYQRFIKDFLKIARPLTKLLEKDTPFEFSDECHKAFNSLKEKLTCTPVIVSPNWNLPFELMCDASKFTVGAVLEFDIEIKDKKGTKHVATDHLSQIENDETSDDSDVDDNFHGETLMEITTRDIPWFADFANYLAEAQALPTNNARVVISFLKKLFCHFGMSKALISDQGKDNLAIWSRKLDDALWAFGTAYKSPTGTTPYKLLYGKICHLPFEIEHRAYWALKNYNPDLIAAGSLEDCPCSKCSNYKCLRSPEANDRTKTRDSS